MNRDIWIGDYCTSPKELLQDAIVAVILLPALVALIALAVAWAPA